MIDVILCYKCVSCGKYEEVSDTMSSHFLSATKKICKCIVTPEKENHDGKYRYEVPGIMELAYVKVVKK